MLQNRSVLFQRQQRQRPGRGGKRVAQHQRQLLPRRLIQSAGQGKARPDRIVPAPLPILLQIGAGVDEVDYTYIY